MTAAWPTVADRVIAIFKSVTNALVFDGPPVTSSAPPDYVTVGYVEDDAAGSYVVEAVYDGTQLLETGTVVAQVVTQSGDTKVAALRARAFAIADAFADVVRADRTLGVLSADATTSLSTEIATIQNSKGSAQSLVCTLSYSTRY